jgi:hypothetical protein
VCLAESEISREPAAIVLDVASAGEGALSRAALSATACPLLKRSAPRPRPESSPRVDNTLEAIVMKWVGPSSSHSRDARLWVIDRVG